MRDADRVLLDAAGNQPACAVVAIEAGAVPADVRVEVPGGLDDRLDRRERTVRPRAGVIDEWHGLTQDGIEFEPSGGRGVWVQGGGRHRRHLVAEVDRCEPRRVDGPGSAGDARCARSGDDDQGERRDERGARDDSGESHYCRYLTRVWLAGLRTKVPSGTTREIAAP